MASPKLRAGLVAFVSIIGGSAIDCSGRSELRSEHIEMSPAMARTIREHTRTDHRGLEVVRRPDGSMSVDLRRRFRSVPVAWIDEQGKTQITEGAAVGLERDSE